MVQLEKLVKVFTNLLKLFLFKTSIVNRFVNSYFNKDYRQTIGIDFFSHIINLPGFRIILFTIL